MAPEIQAKGQIVNYTIDEPSLSPLINLDLDQALQENFATKEPLIVEPDSEAWKFLQNKYATFFSQLVKLAAKMEFDFGAEMRLEMFRRMDKGEPILRISFFDSEWKNYSNYRWLVPFSKYGTNQSAVYAPEIDWGGAIEVDDDLNDSILIVKQKYPAYLIVDLKDAGDTLENSAIGFKYNLELSDEALKVALAKLSEVMGRYSRGEEAKKFADMFSITKKDISFEENKPVNQNLNPWEFALLLEIVIMPELSAHLARRFAPYINEHEKPQIVFAESSIENDVLSLTTIVNLGEYEADERVFKCKIKIHGTSELHPFITATIEDSQLEGYVAQ